MADKEPYTNYLGNKEKEVFLQKKDDHLYDK